VRMREAAIFLFRCPLMTLGMLGATMKLVLTNAVVYEIEGWIMHGWQPPGLRTAFCFGQSTKVAESGVDGFSPKVIWGVVKEKAKTFSQAATSTLRGAFLRLLLNSDTAEDGDRDRTVGAGGDFPAENVALKFISAHLSGVVIVRKS
jgi:hypothetical protein